MLSKLSVAGVLTLLFAGCSAMEDLGDPAGGDDGGDDDANVGSTGGPGEPGPVTQAGGNKGGGKVLEGRAPGDLAACAGSGLGVAYYLSADDSNSMASPARARELLLLGQSPAPAEIRAHEFLNYYNVFTGSNAGGISVSAHMAPGAAKLQQLLVTVESAPLETPAPKSLTFVVDTSGSMSGESLGRARVALQEIAGQLQAGDRVSLVTWSEDAPLLDGLEVLGPDDPTLLDAVNSLEAGGGADIVAGLAAGYDLAATWQHANGLNRVVLVSDGGVSTVDIDQQTIASFAAAGDLHGIYIVGVGTGPAVGYSDKLMDFVTEAGRGAYVYLDGQLEAKRMFGDRFDEVMDVAARDVQVELTLPDFFDIAEFYGEGYSEEAAAIQPQHLAPSDSMAFYQTLSSACSKDQLPPDAVVQVKVTWVDALDGAQREQVLTKTLAELYDKNPALDKAAAIAAYAKALQTVDPVRLQAAHAAALSALQTNPADADLEEIAELVQLHPAF